MAIDELRPSLGPIAKSEQLLLEAVCNLIDPKIIVEFGYGEEMGAVSSKIILNSIDKDAKLYSYDIVKAKAHNDKRHTFYRKDMRDFSDEDVDGKVDLVLFDASHDYDDYVAAFEKIQHHSPLIMVHDTGMYNKEIFNHGCTKTINGVTYNRYENYRFIKELEKTHNLINFTCLTKIRHGIALLKKR